MCTCLRAAGRSGGECVCARTLERMCVRVCVRFLGRKLGGGREYGLEAVCARAAFPPWGCRLFSRAGGETEARSNWPKDAVKQHRHREAASAAPGGPWRAEGAVRGGAGAGGARERQPGPARSAARRGAGGGRAGRGAEDAPRSRCRAAQEGRGALSRLGAAGEWQARRCHLTATPPGVGLFCGVSLTGQAQGSGGGLGPQLGVNVGYLSLQVQGKSARTGCIAVTTGPFPWLFSAS